MPDLEISGLDDRIRDLIARAVADAPPAPTIDEHTLEESAVLRRRTEQHSESQSTADHHLLDVEDLDLVGGDGRGVRSEERRVGTEC